MKIKRLAEHMIILNGLTIKNDSNPDGDIEILELGIRSGEKLYEELLIDAQARNTYHPLIYKAVEKSIPFDKLMIILEEMRLAIEDNDKTRVLSLLIQAVPELKTNLFRKYGSRFYERYSCFISE